jgi:hypothetical protein
LIISTIGKNIGRQFYSCASNTCKFFFWADGNNNFRSKSSNSDKPTPSVSKIVPKCPTHQMACILKTTNKPGQNTGRKFFVCPESSMDKKCLFIWEDEFIPTDTNSCDTAQEILYVCSVNFQAISDDTLEIVLPIEREYLNKLRQLAKEIEGTVFGLIFKFLTKKKLKRTFAPFLF